MTVSWTDRPEEFSDRPKFTKFLSPGPGETLKLQLLGDSVAGCYVHWHGRSLPCRKPAECPQCADKKGRRWKGFIAAKELPGARLAVLEVTETAWHDLEAIRRSHGKLLGLPVAVKRTGPGRNSPVRISLIHEYFPGMEKDPHPVDVRSHVCRLLGLDN